MRVHDIPTFKATQFAPLLNILRKKFPGDLWLDREPGRQAVHEDFANGVLKVTHSLRGHKFVLWVCDKLSLDLGRGIRMRLTIFKPFRSRREVLGRLSELLIGKVV